MSQKLNVGAQERALQVPDLYFKICNLRKVLALFFALEPDGNCQVKGNSGYAIHAAKIPCAEGPSRAL